METKLDSQGSGIRQKDKQKNVDKKTETKA